MIQHIVIWKLLDEAEGNSAEANFLLMKEKLGSLIGKIPEIRSLSVVKNENPDTRNADAALITTFDSLQDLQVYVVHPEHVKVASFVGRVTSGRSAIDFTL